MYTIGKLCKEYHLSRSTLLYYDRIGLLKSSGRTDSEYRIYSEEDKKRLGFICTFREAGVPLEQIKKLLDSDEADESRILKNRLTEINGQIRYMRLQQNIIVEMLKARNNDEGLVLLDKGLIASLFRSAGLEEEMLGRFHAQFEKSMPDTHQFFLEFLGIPPEQIRHIRKHSKE